MLLSDLFSRETWNKVKAWHKRRNGLEASCLIIGYLILLFVLITTAADLIAGRPPMLLLCTGAAGGAPECQ